MDRSAMHVQRQQAPNFQYLLRVFARADITDTDQRHTSVDLLMDVRHHAFLFMIFKRKPVDGLSRKYADNQAFIGQLVL